MTREFYEKRNNKIDELFQTKQTVTLKEQMISNTGEESYHMRFLFPLQITERGKSKTAAVGYSFNISEIKQAENEQTEKRGA